MIHNFVGRSPCKPHQHAVAHLRSLGGDAGGRIPLYPGISRHIPVYPGSFFLFAGGSRRRCDSTKYHRWQETLGERQFLFDTLQYLALGTLARTFHGLFCKSASESSLSILRKLEADSTIRRHLTKSGPSVHWVRVPGYFCQFFLRPPMARPERGGRARVRGEVKTIHVAEEKARRLLHALLNSTTYYLFFDAYSDGRHINPADVYDFPFSLESFTDGAIVDLGRLSQDLQDAMTEHTSQWRKSGLLIDSVDSKLCKPIIDGIDRVLARHYGFTDEELDFILNYDIKYRMGESTSRTT